MIFEKDRIVITEKDRVSRLSKGTFVYNDENTKDINGIYEWIPQLFLVLEIDRVLKQFSLSSQLEIDLNDLKEKARKVKSLDELRAIYKERVALYPTIPNQLGEVDTARILTQCYRAKAERDRGFEKLICSLPDSMYVEETPNRVFGLDEAGNGLNLTNKTLNSLRREINLKFFINKMDHNEKVSSLRDQPQGIRYLKIMDIDLIRELIDGYDDIRVLDVAKSIPEENYTPEIAELLVSKTGFAFNHIPFIMRNTKLLDIAVEDNPTALKYARDDSPSYDNCLKACKAFMLGHDIDSHPLKFFDENKQDLALCVAAVDGDPQAYMFVRSPFNEDPEVISLALKMPQIIGKITRTKNGRNAQESEEYYQASYRLATEALLNHPSHFFSIRTKFNNFIENPSRLNDLNRLLSMTQGYDSVSLDREGYSFRSDFLTFLDTLESKLKKPTFSLSDEFVDSLTELSEHLSAMPKNDLILNERMELLDSLLIELKSRQHQTLTVEDARSEKPEEKGTPYGDMSL